MDCRCATSCAAKVKPSGDDLRCARERRAGNAARGTAAVTAIKVQERTLERGRKAGVLCWGVVYVLGVCMEVVLRGGSKTDRNGGVYYCPILLCVYFVVVERREAGIFRGY